MSKTKGPIKKEKVTKPSNTSGKKPNTAKATKEAKAAGGQALRKADKKGSKKNKENTGSSASAATAQPVAQQSQLKNASPAASGDASPETVEALKARIKELEGMLSVMNAEYVMEVGAEVYILPCRREEQEAT